jgi:hypothetical protein
MRDHQRLTRHGGGLGLGHAVVLVVFLGIIVGAVFVSSYKWSFYLGGNFHVLPWWQGMGKLHTRTGDYLLFVWIAPQTRDVRASTQTNLTGDAHICTPRGENIYLRLGGGMRKHLNLSTDAEAINLDMSGRNPMANMNGDYSPHLEFKGHWQNPSLVMDDRGTISKAFRPDGTIYHARDRNPVNTPEVVPITLSSTTFSAYKAACNAMGK